MKQKKLWASTLFLVTIITSIFILPVTAKHNTIVINVKSKTGKRVEAGTAIGFKQSTGTSPKRSYYLSTDNHGRVIFRIYENYFDLDEPIDVYILSTKLATFYLSKNYSAKLTITCP